MELQVGSILEGKVTSITKFGAFVALEGGKSGLVHISEIANTFVNDVHDFLQEGQTVKVMVLSAENGKINLSIKKAQPPQERPFTVVNLYARLRGYEQIENENLQVFADTTTNQDLAMIPLSELPGRWDQTEIFDTPPQNL